MVVIRLARRGAKKRPFYNIVVADSRKARDGRYIERVGYFNPIARGEEIGLFVEQDRVEHWQSQGAQPSERVISLLRQFKEQADPQGAGSETNKTTTHSSSVNKKKQKEAKVDQSSATE